MENNSVILIGMPGCGKSTVGVLLAKALLYSFIDTDLLIQQREGKPLQALVNSLGIDGFCRIEEDVVSSVCAADSTVIATGGSVVYSESAMQHLKRLGKVVYLKLTADEIVRRVKNIKTRGIVMHGGQTLEGLYNERVPLYEKYADITVDCNKNSIEESVAAVMKALGREPVI